MENEILNQDTVPLQTSKPFNYKRHALWLLVASIVGIILSFAFYKILTNSIGKCSWDFGGNCVPEAITLAEKAVILKDSMFYGLIAFVFLISAIFLINRKRIGIYFFLSGIVGILLSFFISSSYDPSESLFKLSISDALASGLMVGYFYGILIIIGVLFYFITIFCNLFHIRKWFKITMK